MQTAVIKAPSQTSLGAAREVLALLGDNKKLKSNLAALEGAAARYAKEGEAARKETAAVEHAREAIEAENGELSKLSAKLKKKEDTLRAAAATLKATKCNYQKEYELLGAKGLELEEEKYQCTLLLTQLKQRDEEQDTREALLTEQARKLERKAERIIAIAGE